MPRGSGFRGAGGEGQVPLFLQNPFTGDKGFVQTAASRLFNQMFGQSGRFVPTVGPFGQMVLDSLNVGASMRAGELRLGAHAPTLNQTTVTPGAAKYTRVQLLKAIGTQWMAYDSDEDDQSLVCDLAFAQFQVHSTVAFSVVPFIARLENGETIPTTDSDTIFDPKSAIDAALAALGNYAIKMAAEPLTSRKIFSNGSPVYIAEGSFDFTKEMKNFLKIYYQKQIDEENNPIFQIGVFAYASTANTAVVIDEKWHDLYHFKTRKPAI
jgi:hypothetical protein